MKNASEFLGTYVRYNLWANEQVAGLLSQLSEGDLDREMQSSFPTIRKTAFHIWDAEHIWLTRLKGTSLTDWPSKTIPANTPAERFTTASKEFLDFVSGKDEDYFLQKTEFKTMNGDPFSQLNSQMIMHCMNHSTFHRGQLITMMRATGRNENFPRTDMIIFFRDEL